MNSVDPAGLPALRMAPFFPHCRMKASVSSRSRPLRLVAEWQLVQRLLRMGWMSSRNGCLKTFTTSLLSLRCAVTIVFDFKISVTVSVSEIGEELMLNR